MNPSCDARGLGVEDCVSDPRCTWTADGTCVPARGASAIPGPGHARHASPAQCAEGSAGALAWDALTRRCIVNPAAVCPAVEGRADCQATPGCSFRETAGTCEVAPHMAFPYDTWCTESVPFFPCITRGFDHCADICAEDEERRRHCEIVRGGYNYHGCVARVRDRVGEPHAVAALPHSTGTHDHGHGYEVVSPALSMTLPALLLVLVMTLLAVSSCERSHGKRKNR